MCGVAGFLLKERDQPDESLRARLRSMTRLLTHRGPDNLAAWTDGRAGFGHARLSIIDLTAAANQPMFTEDGRLGVIFNGEIYNFRELRDALTAAGYAFRTRSDTETILHGYAAWGTGVFARLRGMFAIAIWDGGRNRLVLARDRVGKKPLYYANTGDAFLFASEIKSILAWPTVPRRPDLAAIDQYLTFQYVPFPRTAFEGISKFPPAHYMVLDADKPGAAPTFTRYWSLPEPRRAECRQHPAQLCEELLARFEEAVRIRLVSDVPLGAFLSGGVDSSAVVAMMAQNGEGTVKTFSIGFSEKEYDERRFARMVADRYGTDHEDLVVEPDVVSILPRLVWHYGEPFADPSAVPTYCVSEMARRRVTVALNGDGGDENFFGYTRYPAVQALQWADRAPGALRRLAARLVGLLPMVPQRRRGRLRELLERTDRPPWERYEFTIAYFSDRDKSQGYGEALTGFLEDSALRLLAPYFAQGPDMVSGARWADIHTYLPDDLLVKVDVASMAHGLEARSPFLDHELMEWAMTVPADMHMRGGETKNLLKRAMEPYLPREILYRDKMGFGCPVDVWLREDLKELAYDTLLSDRCRARGLFRPEYVRGILDDHCSGAAVHHTRLWAMLMLELWYDMWIDAPTESALARPAA